VRRMSGTEAHLAILADCERALGRPDRALELFRSPEAAKLPTAERMELLIVASGARRDLGQDEAALVMLQVPELEHRRPAPWLARLRYAYADSLAEAGRGEEARDWLARAAEVDDDDVTDAAERLLELDGILIEDDDDFQEDGDFEEGDDIDGAPSNESLDEQPDGEQSDDGEQTGDQGQARDDAEPRDAEQVNDDDAAVIDDAADGRTEAGP
jgi:tetratricopeptide (TPR) repeat protein